jgi:small subunit ribosomal protein S5
MVRATIDCLSRQVSPRQIANKRGLKVGDIVGRRRDGASAEGEASAEA